MHIYIRTGDNENTGIEFLNGKGWTEPHLEQKGFTYTPKDAPARKYEFKDERYAQRGSWGTKNEKSLAALVLLSEELNKVPEGETIESVTWINVGGRGLSSCDMLIFFRLEDFKGVQGGEALIDEVKHLIYAHLNEGPKTVEVVLTDEDLERVTYDNTERDAFGCLAEHKPQGFSVAFDDRVLHYSVPEFLRRTVYTLNDEQGAIAKAVLLADALSKLGPSESVSVTLPGVIDENADPAPAGEVLERIQHFICAITVNDKEDVAEVRKVNIDAEALERITFKNAPEYTGTPSLVSDLYYYRSMHKLGFEVQVHTGRVWKFTPVNSGTQALIYMRKFEDRTLAVAALAVLGVADKHHYYGELQVVSDVLSERFLESVNYVLKGRDVYELVNYLKEYFKVEEVRN